MRLRRGLILRLRRGSLCCARLVHGGLAAAPVTPAAQGSLHEDPWGSRVPGERNSPGVPPAFFHRPTRADGQPGRPPNRYANPPTGMECRWEPCPPWIPRRFSCSRIGPFGASLGWGEITALDIRTLTTFRSPSKGRLGEYWSCRMNPYSCSLRWATYRPSLRPCRPDGTRTGHGTSGASDRWEGGVDATRASGRRPFCRLQSSQVEQYLASDSQKRSQCWSRKTLPNPQGAFDPRSPAQHRHPPGYLYGPRSRSRSPEAGDGNRWL